MDPAKESKIYWGYWVSPVEGQVTTTVSLHGTEIPGSSFTVTVENEAETFTTALPYARLGTLPVDTERGVRILFVCLFCPALRAPVILFFFIPGHSPRGPFLFFWPGSFFFVVVGDT